MKRCCLNRFYPLQDIGYIKIIKPTIGRGAKPFIVKPTEKLKNEVMTPLLEALEIGFETDVKKTTERYFKRPWP